MEMQTDRDPPTEQLAKGACHAAAGAGKATDDTERAYHGAHRHVSRAGNQATAAADVTGSTSLACIGRTRSNSRPLHARDRCTSHTGEDTVYGGAAPDSCSLLAPWACPSQPAHGCDTLPSRNNLPEGLRCAQPSVTPLAMPW